MLRLTLGGGVYHERGLGEDVLRDLIDERDAVHHRCQHNDAGALRHLVHQRQEREDAERRGDEVEEDIGGVLVELAELGGQLCEVRDGGGGLHVRKSIHQVAAARHQRGEEEDKLHADPNQNVD
eukprot:564165-Rhodomonas_salina.1